MQVNRRSTPSLLMRSSVGPSASGGNPKARLLSTKASSTPVDAPNFSNEAVRISPHDADCGDDPYEIPATFFALNSAWATYGDVPVGQFGPSRQM